MMKLNIKITPPIYGSEKGSAFFYIFLAVALFGALSFTVSRGMRGQQVNIMTERKAEVATSDILGYVRNLQYAVDKVRRNGCSENDISFANKIISGYEHTPISSNECRIFHPDGGNISLQSPPEKVNDGSNWYFSAIGNVPGIGTDTGGELVAMLFNVDKNICADINKRINLGKIIPVNSGSINEVKYQGTYGQSKIISGSTSVQTCPDAPFCNKSTGCFQEETTDRRLILYHVLIAR